MIVDMDLRRFDTPLQLGEVYVNDAASRSTPTDPVSYYWAVAPVIFNDLLKEVLGPDSVEPASSKTHAWCEATFGPTDPSTWFVDGDRWCFVSEQDRTMFVMRWA
jgi:hypothetical protein